MAKVVVISWLARGRNDSPQGEIVIRWDYDGGGEEHRLNKQETANEKSFN